MSRRCRGVGRWRGAVSGFSLAATLAVGIEFPRAAMGGVTRSYPADHLPVYRGAVPRGARVAYAKVRLAPLPAGSPEGWLPRRALEKLAEEMDRRIAARGEMLLVAAGLPAEGMPSVSLGCASADDAAGECDPKRRQPEYSVTAPTKRFRQALSPLLATSGRDHLLFVELSIRDHWIRQKDLAGRKEVPLGTGHRQPAPWLTSLDTPVEVLQLSAALVDVEGKVARSGVEGLLAVPTSFGASTLGLQRTIGERDVEHLRTDLRRSDLVGAPLVWEVALDALLEATVGAPSDRAVPAPSEPTREKER